MVPRGQDWHTAPDVAATTDEYFPRGHGVQPPLAVAFPRNDPAAHGVHAVSPASEKNPSAHATHALDADAPAAADAVFAGQATHALDVCPGAELKVPATHGSHAATDVAPGVSRNLPAEQSAQLFG